MADQKRWYKVWTSILSDDDFDSKRDGTLIDIGRWTLLGAYTSLHGTKGVVEVMPDTLLSLLQVKNLDEIRDKILFKNVSFEEGKNRYGKVTVTWKNWRSYQDDSTAKERQRTLRAKRRGEEKRGEEIRKEVKNPPTPQGAGSDGFERFWDSYPRKKSRGQAEKAWRKIHPDEQLQDRIIKSLELAKTSGDWTKDHGKFIPYPATWLNAKGWEDDHAESAGGKGSDLFGGFEGKDYTRGAF